MLNNFAEILSEYSWEDVRENILSMQENKVRAFLSAGSVRENRMEAFATLISPAALPFLDQLATLSSRLTRERFGRNINLYIPLYLSNECQNICTYCGFSLSNRIPRKTLSDPEILREVEILKSYGYDNVLLVTGEAQQTVGVDYLAHAVQLVKPYFSQVSIEVQPLEQAEYERLKAEGVYAVLVYQETYHREAYRQYHPKGRKSNFEYRLDTPDRLGRAGIHKIGLGVLLGLEDWRSDSFFNALHLDYLQRTFWQTKYSVSFPRIRPHEGDFIPQSTLSEKELLQLICAYRICFPDAELSLSSRERPAFRDALIPFGITSMSAGSKTDPGGYAAPETQLKQFEIHDGRSPQEVAQAIRAKNYEPVWKDWDAVLY